MFIQINKKEIPSQELIATPDGILKVFNTSNFTCHNCDGKITLSAEECEKGWFIKQKVWIMDVKCLGCEQTGMFTIPKNPHNLTLLHNFFSGKWSRWFRSTYDSNHPSHKQNLSIILRGEKKNNDLWIESL